MKVTVEYIFTAYTHSKLVVCEIYLFLIVVGLFALTCSDMKVNVNLNTFTHPDAYNSCNFGIFHLIRTFASPNRIRSREVRISETVM